MLAIRRQVAAAAVFVVAVVAVDDISDEVVKRTDLLTDV